jgi:hypothetical protein
VCVQIRQKIAATAKIKHAESCLTSHNVPNTSRGHNRPTVLQEAQWTLKMSLWNYVIALSLHRGTQIGPASNVDRHVGLQTGSV